jgi:hypoxanthine phosphoribosyltransferase
MTVPGLRLRYGRDEIAERVAALGDEIGRVYARRDPVLVTLLMGGCMFLADLVRAVPLRLRLDFLGVSLLQRAPSSVALTKDLEIDIAGQHVLIVDNLVDTGLTLSYLVRTLAARDPASLRVCTLLDRPARRMVSLPIDHVGFEIGAASLVGYGLDQDGWFRNLPDLWEIVDERAVRANPAAALAATQAGRPEWGGTGSPGTSR